MNNDMTDKEKAIDFLECRRAYYASLSTDPNPNVKATKVCGYTLAESANACLGAIKALKEESKWTPISEGYPPIEDKYKDFLVTDDKGEITVQKLYFTIDIKRQPYFSGMVNPVAWMPSPLPYKVESEVEE